MFSGLWRHLNTQKNPAKDSWAPLGLTRTSHEEKASEIIRLLSHPAAVPVDFPSDNHRPPMDTYIHRYIYICIYTYIYIYVMYMHIRIDRLFCGHSRNTAVESRNIYNIEKDRAI